MHEIPTRFSDRLGDVASLGNEIIWVGSGSFWRYSPSAAEPELVIADDPDEPIISIAGGSSGYVYRTQEVTDSPGPIRWRLWYIAAPGATPVVIDAYDNDGLPAPRFAMDGRRIVWSAFHGREDDAVSSLQVLEIDRIGDEPRELVAYPAFDTSLWHPVLHGDEVWYGVNRNDWDAGTVHPRVEMLDLANPATAPVAYGEDVRAFMPAVNDQIVAWKGGGTPDLAALNAGQLFISWRDGGAAEPIAIPSGSWDRISYPSVGSRFVCWWDDLATHFYVYDIEQRGVRVIAEYEPTGRERILRPSLTGNLLVFIYTHGERFPQQVRWATLPE
jgi:hypothetical protein